MNYDSVGERIRIRAFAKDFGIPIATADKAWRATEGNYAKALDWIKENVFAAAIKAARHA